MRVMVGGCTCSRSGQLRQRFRTAEHQYRQGRGLPGRQAHRGVFAPRTTQQADRDGMQPVGDVGYGGGLLTAIRHFVSLC